MEVCQGLQTLPENERHPVHLEPAEPGQELGDGTLDVLEQDAAGLFVPLRRPEQVRMIHAYLIREQGKLRAEEQAGNSRQSIDQNR